MMEVFIVFFIVVFILFFYLTCFLVTFFSRFYLVCRGGLVGFTGTISEIQGRLC